MFMKQLSLIALLAAPAVSEAIKFSNDDIIRGGSITALIASPVFAFWSFREAQRNAQLRAAVEAEVPGLTQALVAYYEIDEEKEEKKNPHYTRKTREEIYQQFMSTDSETYKKLMSLTENSRSAAVAMMTSIAAGAFSYVLLHKDAVVTADPAATAETVATTITEVATNLP